MTLVLRLDTVQGAEDVLAAELADHGTARPIGAGWVELRGAPDDGVQEVADRLLRLAAARCFTGVAVPLPGIPREPAFDAALSELIMIMEKAGFAGDHGFRVAEPSTEARDEIAASITAAIGWRQQPSNWVLNLVPGDDGWSAQIGPLHWSRRNAKLERLPWSTPAALADVLVRMAKIRAGHRVLDPCCGSGTLLVAAGLAGATTLYGVDRDPEAVAVATRNLDTLRLPATLRVGDAEALGTMKGVGEVDRIIGNLPFGKQVGSHRDNERLYPALLDGIARRLSADGRAVLLTEDKRLFTDSVQRTRGLKIINQAGFRYGGATPTGYVITRRRR
ncbi:TRM11 family SAM-dependent methyltransferase [Microlunatus soli]|uniref:Putative RNA methylase family UPF0020 n=1 Tax=Microlunatus soli TaxID=630515 RepID=A0A1H2AF37_9ACTN|nr:50S ribosomal protein L11 methyltransferase [Microlunatus soli]SDT44449.1 Putative RNA methylase family UPF0020 [Microlunatus soli]